jgi:predicted N-acetyltransferase YhbS
MIFERQLHSDEIDQIWSIDRREVINKLYKIENGELVLYPDHYDMQGWPPGEAELYTTLLIDCYNRGGWFEGFFDENRLVAVAILDIKFIGEQKDMLQLKFLHVSQDYRHQGLGKQLFEKAKTAARQKGAMKLYISATPSENTIKFYLNLGCRVTPEPDPELYALEPEDIHLEYAI